MTTSPPDSSEGSFGDRRKEPSVTVLMSCYNSEETVGAAVESILAQTHGDFTFVIYDDASCDRTAEVLKSYDDPRIHLRLLGQNRGLSRNLHEGLAEATTPFVARIDADDAAMPDRLAEQLSFLVANPDVAVLGTDVFFIGSGGKQILGRQPSAHDDITIALFFGFTMLHPTVMLRREALVSEQLNYNPRFRYSQDFDLWSRMLIAGHKFANLPKPLMKLRDHPGKISVAKRLQQQRFSTIIRARQIARLRPNAACADVRIFAKAARGDGFGGKSELIKLEAMLLALIDANGEMQLYDRPAFAKAAGDMFQLSCRRMLESRQFAGARFLRSPLRRYAPEFSAKSWLKFIGLCALAGLTGGLESGRKR